MKTIFISAVLAIGGLLSAKGLYAAPAIQFGPVTHYTNTVAGVRGVCTGDFNGDGHIDLVSIGQAINVSTNNWITLWTNNGAGGFIVALPQSETCLMSKDRSPQREVPASKDEYYFSTKRHYYLSYMQ